MDNYVVSVARQLLGLGTGSPIPYRKKKKRVNQAPFLPEGVALQDFWKDGKELKELSSRGKSCSKPTPKEQQDLDSQLQEWELQDAPLDASEDDQPFDHLLGPSLPPLHAVATFCTRYAVHLLPPSASQRTAAAALDQDQVHLRELVGLWRPGVLPCLILNALLPGTLDERAINSPEPLTQPSSPHRQVQQEQTHHDQQQHHQQQQQEQHHHHKQQQHKQTQKQQHHPHDQQQACLSLEEQCENWELCVSSVRALGCCSVTGVTAEDIAQSREEALMQCVVDILKVATLQKLSRHRPAGLTLLQRQGENQLDFSLQGPEALLHRWFCHHLAGAASMGSKPSGRATCVVVNGVKGAYGGGDATNGNSKEVANGDGDATQVDKKKGTGFERVRVVEVAAVLQELVAWRQRRQDWRDYQEELMQEHQHQEVQVHMKQQQQQQQQQQIQQEEEQGHSQSESNPEAATYATPHAAAHAAAHALLHAPPHKASLAAAHAISHAVHALGLDMPMEPAWAQVMPSSVLSIILAAAMRVCPALLNPTQPHLQTEGHEDGTRMSRANSGSSNTVSSVSISTGAGALVSGSNGADGQGRIESACREASSGDGKERAASVMVLGESGQKAPHLTSRNGGRADEGGDKQGPGFSVRLRRVDSVAGRQSDDGSRHGVLEHGVVLHRPQQEQKADPAAKHQTSKRMYQLTDDEGAFDKNEELLLRSWLNQLVGPKLGCHLQTLFDPVMLTGYPLLLACDAIQPGCVRWRQAFVPPFSARTRVPFKIMCTENGNQVCNICANMWKLLLVNIGGIDIAEGHRSAFLSLAWQMMRHHMSCLLEQACLFEAVQPACTRSGSNCVSNNNSSSKLEGSSDADVSKVGQCSSTAGSRKASAGEAPAWDAACTVLALHPPHTNGGKLPLSGENKTSSDHLGLANSHSTDHSQHSHDECSDRALHGDGPHTCRSSTAAVLQGPGLRPTADHQVQQMHHHVPVLPGPCSSSSPSFDHSGHHTEDTPQSAQSSPSPEGHSHKHQQQHTQSAQQGPGQSSTAHHHAEPAGGDDSHTHTRSGPNQTHVKLHTSITGTGAGAQADSQRQAGAEAHMEDHHTAPGSRTSGQQACARSVQASQGQAWLGPHSVSVQGMGDKVRWGHSLSLGHARPGSQVHSSAGLVPALGQGGRASLGRACSLNAQVSEKRSLQVSSSQRQKRQIEDDVLRWANARLAEGNSFGLGSEGSCSQPLASLSDPRLAEGQVLLQLLDAISPGSVRSCHVSPGQTEAQRESNAKYAVSVARKLGCFVFLSAEDIVSGKPALMLMLLVAIMARDRALIAREQSLC